MGEFRVRAAQASDMVDPIQDRLGPGESLELRLVVKTVSDDHRFKVQAVSVEKNAEKLTREQWGKYKDEAKIQEATFQVEVATIAPTTATTGGGNLRAGIRLLVGF